MHRIAEKDTSGLIETVRASKPHGPGKTTSVITRGGVVARESRQSAVIADDVVAIIGLLAIALSRWLAAPPSERPTLVINQSLEAAQTGGKAVGWTRSIPASLHLHPTGLLPPSGQPSATRRG